MPFYNFFNNAANRLYESGWRARLAMSGRDLPEMTGFERETYDKGRANMKVAMAGFVTFALIPALIEELVDPLPYKKGESQVWYWSKVVARGPASMVPILRDMIRSLMEGDITKIGLFDTPLEDLRRPLAAFTPIFDPVRWPIWRDPGKWVREVYEALGVATGMSYAEVGKLGDYVWNVHRGKERPKGMPDYYWALREGTDTPRQRRDIDLLINSSAFIKGL